MTIEDMVRERGPMTVAAFMDLALYDPRLGYYARASRRSGRAGDFFTSVDVGPIFGALLSLQIEEMFDLLDIGEPDLVEAGASNGRLAADILHALHERRPGRSDAIRLHLIESSAEARHAHRETLGAFARQLASSSESLPPSFHGVLLANELVDAFPVHQVLMRDDGLREVYVTPAGDGLTTREGALSTPAIADYFADLQVALEPGWRAEVNLRAVEWLREVARRLERGFVILIDYGHEARDLYSVSHASGTLMTFSRHQTSGPGRGRPDWLEEPGQRDLTAHVDFTTLRNVAEAEGLHTIGFMDQTYFLLGLVAGSDLGAGSLQDRLALKTLLMPGGLGSTHKVLLLGKNVGSPQLRGCGFRQRVT